MSHNKKGSPNHQFSCEICEIDSMSIAEYALHEFTKKHCDNLIRLAKNKPILKKQKLKNKIPAEEKKPVKVNTVTHTGSFAKYGYFVPGEVYIAAKDPKEFNSDYDPYLQKFAGNPLEEKVMPVVEQEFQQQCTAVLPPIISLSKKKKKKKNNIKTCQICNVTLLTTPSYEAHMKSPEHILKLKVSGMGVSAHFVKASSDLHTTDTKDNQRISENSDPLNHTSNCQNYTSETASLYCNVCELLLNSHQQYTAHVAGKYHNDCVKKKMEENEVLENPSDKLFCYTCNILLNTVFQYNEHKNGKKHKIKCRALIRKGMSIPPEERVPGIGIPNSDPSTPVYPELYIKTILERQNQPVSTTVKLGTGSCINCSELFPETESFNQNRSLTNVTENSGKDPAPTAVKNEINCTSQTSDETSNYELLKRPNFTFHKINFVSAKTSENNAVILNSVNRQMSNENFCANKSTKCQNNNQESINNVTVLNIEGSLHCSICNENFQWQCQFDMHLTQEKHFKNIIALKLSGKSDNEILNLIFADRNIVKPNNLGKLTCSICKVTVNNSSEFEQHLNCVVHKYTEKDYKQKRTLEVKQMVPCDETRMYYCKFCKIGLTSLVEFSQHLFSAKHKSTQKKRKTSRIIALSQRQRFSLNLKRKYILLQSIKADKNPGVRTKISGLATDLFTGAQSKVPNLELLEPKIEPTKNVSIGVSEKSDGVEASKRKRFTKSNNRIRRHLFKGNKQVQGFSLKQPNSDHLPPSILSCNFPPVNFSRYPNGPYGWSPYPSNAPPVYNSHLPPFGPFYGRPSMNNTFRLAPCFRTPWRNYP